MPAIDPFEPSLVPEVGQFYRACPKAADLVEDSAQLISGTPRPIGDSFHSHRHAHLTAMVNWAVRLDIGGTFLRGFRCAGLAWYPTAYLKSLVYRSSRDHSFEPPLTKK